MSAQPHHQNDRQTNGARSLNQLNHTNQMNHSLDNYMIAVIKRRSLNQLNDTNQMNHSLDIYELTEEEIALVKGLKKQQKLKKMISNKKIDPLLFYTQTDKFCLQKVFLAIILYVKTPLLQYKFSKPKTTSPAIYKGFIKQARHG